MHTLRCLGALQGQAAAQHGRHWGFAEGCAAPWKPLNRNTEADKIYKSRKFTDAELYDKSSSASENFLLL